MIIRRYLHREVLNTMLVTTAVLLVIFIANQFIRYLGDAAIGRLTAHAVLRMMSIQIPLLAGFMLPLGFYLGVLLGFGRLYADSEMTILFGCGISRRQLLSIGMMAAGAVSVIVAVLMLWVEPNMAWYRDHILAEAAAASPLQKVVPGRFQVVGGRWVFYVNDISRDHQQMQDVFAANVPSKKNPQPMNVVLARSAKSVRKGNEGFIQFNNGNRYLGRPGQGDYQIVQYDDYGVRLPTRKVEMRRLSEFLPTTVLWQEQWQNPVAAGELQWRIAMPISVILLTLIAVPLSQVQPRQGRFAAIIPAMLIYIAYIDLLMMGQAWMEKGVIGPLLGLWWIHALMLALGGFISWWWIRPTASKGD